MIINLTGGTGTVSPMNYSVTGGLTEPAAPGENTIWVLTDTAVTGYCFDTVQPEAAQEGFVWFCTGDYERIRFNVLKENELILRADRAMQYIDGVWVYTEAKIYQEGIWNNWWNGILYAPGDECGNVTGGWIAEAIPRSSDGTGSKRTITSGAESLQVAGVASKGGLVRTANKINLHGRTSLVFDGAFYNPATGGTAFWCSLCVWSDIGTTTQENVVAALHCGYGTLEGQQTLDLSQVPDGSYYIGFALYGTSTVTMTGLQVI